MLVLCAAVVLPAPAFAAEWSDVLFPSEYVEAVDGVDTHFLAHDYDPDRRDVFVDANGEHWARTPSSIFRLPADGNAWIEANEGLGDTGTDSYLLTSSALYYEEGTQKLFLFTDYSGWFVRGLGETSWRPADATAGESGSYGVPQNARCVMFGGYIWATTFDGLVQLDPVTETAATANDAGLPSTGFDMPQQYSNIVVTDGALYLGVYDQWTDGSQPTSFPDVDVYRLDDPGGTWERTGLAATPIDAELDVDAYSTPRWGVFALHATEGYVFASVCGSDPQANRLFVLDEATGAWTLVPLPDAEPVMDDSTGHAHYPDYFLAAWDAYPVFDAKLYGNPQPEPGTSDTDARARFSLYDPRTGTWELDVLVDAKYWTPAMPGDVMFVGEDVLISRHNADYYDIPESRGTGFVSSVPLPTQVSTDPEVIGTNAFLALVFALAFGSLSTVFNSTLKENHAVIAGWFAPITRPSRRAWERLFAEHAEEEKRGALTRIAAKIPLRRVWQPLAIVTLSAVVYGFLDPAFGFSMDGLGLLISLAVAVGVTTYTYEGLQSLISSRRLGAPARVRMFPAAIVIAVVCVVISRVMSFHPGYVFGIVGGLAFSSATEPDSKRFGRTVLLSAAVLLLVSLGAWFAAIPAAAAAENTGGFLAVTVQASLIAVFVMGLEALLFGLLPLGFMDGEKVMRFSKVAWLAAFSVVAFAFWHILLNPSSTYLDSLGQKNVVMMLVLLVVYGLITLVMYLYSDRALGSRRHRSPHRWH